MLVDDGSTYLRRHGPIVQKVLIEFILQHFEHLVVRHLCELTVLRQDTPLKKHKWVGVLVARVALLVKGKLPLAHRVFLKVPSSSIVIILDVLVEY